MCGCLCCAGDSKVETVDEIDGAGGDGPADEAEAIKVCTHDQQHVAASNALP